MSRIALLVPTLGGGGAERVMVTLASGFAARGHAVDLLLVRGEGPYLGRVPPSVTVIELGSRRIATSLPALVRYLRRIRPAVLLSTLDTANVIAVCARALAGVPTRLVLRQANAPAIANARSPKLRARLLPTLMRWTYPRAERIVAITSAMADDLVRSLGLDEGALRVIHNPAFDPDILPRAEEELGHPWFRVGEPPVILSVGRLTEQKDYATLIRAFAILRRRRPVRLVILGEGPDRPRLEGSAGELGVERDLWLPGFVENPHKYMRRAALFVQSSRWEGFPNVLVEALACGTPVVATSCPGGAAEILENGKWGTLVPPGSPEALAAGLDAALHETTSDGRRRALRDRAEDFSLDAALAGYSAVMFEDV